ncbi:MAG: M48 family metallopeptidase [Methylococcaceae bacterium]
MKTFKANLCNEKQPLTGISVEAYFDNKALHIKNPAITIAVEYISVSVGGFEHNELFLNWYDNDNQAHSLKLIDKTTIQWLIENAPTQLHYQLNKWHKRDLSIKLVWGSLLGLALIAVLATTLLWWQYDNTVAWLTNKITIAQEESLGKAVLARLESDDDLIKQGIAVDTIKTIGDKLTKNSLYHYQWRIKKDKSVNAFALPAGIVVVNSGLIASIDNADELAAVLAHEIQHVEQRHGLKSMIDSLGWASALMLVLGDVNTATAIIVHQLGNMYFSRDKEEQADKLGFQALIKANIKPNAMLAVLEKLEKIHGNNGLEWLSSHPDTSARIKVIQKLLNENHCNNCQSLSIDWKKVQQDKNLLK